MLMGEIPVGKYFSTGVWLWILVLVPGLLLSMITMGFWAIVKEYPIPMMLVWIGYFITSILIVGWGAQGAVKRVH